MRRFRTFIGRLVYCSDIVFGAFAVAQAASVVVLDASRVELRLGIKDFIEILWRREC